MSALMQNAQRMINYGEEVLVNNISCKTVHECSFADLDTTNAKILPLLFALNLKVNGFGVISIMYWVEKLYTQKEYEIVEKVFIDLGLISNDKH